ncbi:hypothetical protein HA402_014089 [Bradysia odoriphaga]|nr:hypothetical protein HA402_014089 [Bradysia odoriphaga]
MRKAIFCAAFFVCVLSSFAQTTSSPPAPGQPLVGAPFDEIIVESSLNVRKKPEPARRRTRSLAWNVINPEHVRSKRQFQHQYNSFNPYNLNRYTPLNIPSNSVSHSNANSQSLSFGNPDYSSSASQANANSNSLGYGPQGFGNGAALAQSQGFQSVGPLGSFGATSANSQTQSFQAGLNGFQGASGLSNSQTYTLPNGQTINLAITNAFSNGPNGHANGQGNSISIA